MQMDVFTINFIVFLYGAVIGSFLNVVILRLPEEGVSIAFPASHCPQCKTALHWYENIPVFSYIVLRGRCRTCKKTISMQYPLVELAMGVFSVLLVQKFMISPAFFIYFIYVAALLVIIVIDLYHQIIPDVISLPGIIYGVLASFVLPSISWQESLIGLFVGGGVFYLIALVYYLFTKRQGMGGGDIKLLAMIGALQGWQALPFVIFCSSLLGSIIGIGAMVVQKKGGQTRIHYGPFLAAASLLYLFFDQQILHYMQLYLGG